MKLCLIDGVMEGNKEHRYKALEIEWNDMAQLYMFFIQGALMFALTREQMTELKKCP